MGEKKNPFLAGLQSENFRTIVGFIAILVIISSAYSYVEDVSLFDAIYWTITTSSTVGYGDITPVTTLGRILALAVMIMGVGIVGYIISTLSKTLVAVNMNKAMGLGSTSRRNHVVLLGWNKVAKEALRELVKEGESVVVVAPKTHAEINAYKGVRFILGPCDDVKTLLKAGVKRAKAVIAAMEEDAEVILTISKIKTINRAIPIIARIDDLQYKDVAVQAGSHRIVSPTEIGGDLLFSALHKPAVVDWILEITNSGSGTVISDFIMEGKSKLYGKPIHQLPLKKNQMVLAYDADGDEIIDETLPSMKTIMHKVDALVLLEDLGEKRIQLHRTHKTRTAKKNDTLFFCGYTPTVRSAAKTFSKMQTITILAPSIDPVEERELKKLGITIIKDTVTKYHMQKAKIEKAHHVIVDMPTDSETILMAYIAQHLNHKASLTVVMDDDENKTSAVEVGADQMLSPAELGGQLLAKALTHPSSVGWIIDVATHTNTPHVQEHKVTSKEDGKTIGDIQLKAGEFIIGLETADEHKLYTMPKRHHKLAKGDIVVYVEK